MDVSECNCLVESILMEKMIYLFVYTMVMTGKIASLLNLVHLKQIMSLLLKMITMKKNNSLTLSRLLKKNYKVSCNLFS